MSEKKIRLGVLGAGRGVGLAQNALHVGMDVVAFCDNSRPERLEEAKNEFKCETYTDYDEFLSHDMDAVVVANYCYEHAPFAIKALEAGKHVMSECVACKTLGEGVALARAVEKSGKIYMFAENYAYRAYVQEMRRLYLAGEIGELRYAEGEYNHPMDSVTKNQIAPGLNHWRNHNPPTYYPTHAMSPIIYVTDTRPVSVNALSIPKSDEDTQNLDLHVGDPGSVILCRMNNGAVVRLLGFGLRGHSVWYSLHGTRGMMENLRTMNPEYLRVMHEPYDVDPGEPKERMYIPEFPMHGDLAAAAGHAGGDFFVNYYFAEAIRKNEQPYLDVYKGLDMTFLAQQGWRSCLDNGAPYEIPDLRQEEMRKKYENDDWSPFPEDRKPGQPWPSIKGELKPSAEAFAAARKTWDEMGYKGE